MADLTCPSFGTGSIDFNAFHDAAKKAKTNEELVAALAKATTGGSPMAEEESMPEPAPAPAKSPATEAETGN